MTDTANPSAANPADSPSASNTDARTPDDGEELGGSDTAAANAELGNPDPSDVNVDPDLARNDES